MVIGFAKGALVGLTVDGVEVGLRVIGFAEGDLVVLRVVGLVVVMPVVGTEEVGLKDGRDVCSDVDVCVGE
jgi:hypothetical protein